MAQESEIIESLPLMRRRRLLGYAVPLINTPLLLYNLYSVYVHFQQGMSVGDSRFVEDIIVILSALFMSFAIPYMFPVYKSVYRMNENGLQISRLLKGRVEIPYSKIDRAEVFIRETPKISDDAKEYAVDSSRDLRKSGFKFQDYTNNEDIIMNLFSGQKIYMVSPSKPKTLLKKLKRRNKKLSAKIVELHDRGKRIQELGK